VRGRRRTGRRADEGVLVADCRSSWHINQTAIWAGKDGGTLTFASERPERMEGELEDFRLALVLVFECEEGAWLAVRERTNEGSCERDEVSHDQTVQEGISVARWNEIGACMGQT